MILMTKLSSLLDMCFSQTAVIHQEGKKMLDRYKFRAIDVEVCEAVTDNTPLSLESHRIASAFFMCASLSGVCGALSSVIGKMAIMADFIPDAIEKAATDFGWRLQNDGGTIVRNASLALPFIMRALLLILNFFFTTQMWRFYVKSLSLGPVLVAQIVSTGVNFGVSALMGLLVFDEQITLIWALGAVFIIIGLAIIVDSQRSDVTSVSDVSRVHELVVDTVRTSLEQLPRSLFIEVVWLLGHGMFYLCPIGKRVKGTPLRNGKVLDYNINAIHSFFICHTTAFVMHVSGMYNLAELTNMYNSLMLASILISAVMSIGFYLASYRNSNVLTALGGNSGCAVYDFWVGRELNPRTGLLDWKFMCELRPGLIGWSLLNWSFVCKAIQANTFTPAIALIALFESLYVVDGLALEAGCLTMMDIVTDGFGFMLCFGDLCWVPFTYTLQTRYLAAHPVHLHYLYLAMCIAIIVLGFVLFRGANNQKNLFRTNPSHPKLRHLKVMKTSTDRLLLISGFWGICRHPNYVGDWLMSLGWALLCGVGAAIPFFHPIYFGSLLIHRQLRDEEQMRSKYGEKDWRTFCSTVRYRLIPYIY